MLSATFFPLQFPWSCPAWPTRLSLSSLRPGRGTLGSPLEQLQTHFVQLPRQPVPVSGWASFCSHYVRTPQRAAGSRRPFCPGLGLTEHRAA